MHHREHADQEAPEVSATIAQINRRGREVVIEETEQRAADTRSADQGEDQIRLQANGEQQGHDHEANARRQTVDAIDEVDKVGESNQPKYGGEVSQGTQRVLRPRKGVLEMVDV